MIKSKVYYENLPKSTKDRINNFYNNLTPEKFREFIYKTDKIVLSDLFKTELENFMNCSNPSWGKGSETEGEE